MAWEFLTSEWFILLVAVLSLWEAVWKGIALWRAGRNNQLPWYIAIFIINTIGILPIAYLLFFQKKPRNKALRQ